MVLPVAYQSVVNAADTAGRRSVPMAPARDPSTALADTLLDHGWEPPLALTLFRRSGIDDLADRLAVIGAAARLLGDRWVEDSCSFADVTLGLHRLTLLLFAIETLPDPHQAPLHGGTVLLAPTPGDQHSFGLAMVALALRRSGWDVMVELAGDGEALVRLAATRRFDCVGLSVGYDRAVAPTRLLIARLRRAARAAPPIIAVGGPMLGLRPDLVRAVGADIAAEEGFALAARLAVAHARAA